MSGRPLRTASADAEAAVNSQLHNGPTPNKLPRAQLPTNSQRPTPNKLPKVNSQNFQELTDSQPWLSCWALSSWTFWELGVLGVGRWAGRWALIGTWALRSWEFDARGSVHRLARVELEPADEVAEVLPEDQPSAVQARLQRLRLHPQDRARLFRRQAVDVAQQHRHAVDRRQVRERVDQLLAHFGAHDLVVGQRRPVGRLRLRHLAAVRLGLGPVDLGLPVRPRAAQPRHRGIERDPIDPRGQRRVPPESLDLAIDLHQDVLRDLLGIFPVLQVPERKLLNPRAVEGRQVADG